jgi:CRISPR-associated protein Csx3
LYATLSAYNAPEALYLFDARLGWVEAPTLPMGKPDPDAPLIAEKTVCDEIATLSFQMPHAYLDITKVHTCRMPNVFDAGLILSGKLPLWLWAALARAYTAPPWVAVTHPQIQGCVVIRSMGDPAVGAILPLPARLTQQNVDTHK